MPEHTGEGECLEAAQEARDAAARESLLSACPGQVTPSPKPVTEADVRRIVREELASAHTHAGWRNKPWA